MCLPFNFTTYLILKGRIQFYPFIIEPTYPSENSHLVETLNPVSASGLTLKHWPEVNWQSFIFGNFIKVFPYQSNSQNFFKFYCHFSLVDAKKVFSRSALLASRETVLKFCPLAEKRGSLEGVRERGFKYPELNLDRYVYWYRTNINLIDFYSYRKKNL